MNRNLVIELGIILIIGVIMGILGLFKKSDINIGIQQYKETTGAVLIDVRTIAEYEQGHIPGSINIPLQQIQDTVRRIPDKDTPLFVYCRSGSRSSQAKDWLEIEGYTNVTDIGGIMNYSETFERGVAK